MAKKCPHIKKCKLFDETSAVCNDRNQLYNLDGNPYCGNARKFEEDE